MDSKSENGEWLDKEPRADGKPRRWKPSEILTVDESKMFIPTRTQHPVDRTQPRENTSK